MEPVRVDIVAYAPTAFFHCLHCEIAFHHMGIGPRLRRTEADESLPLDLQLEYLDLSVWVHDLHERYGDGVAVRVIDAASIAGVWTSVRHGVRSYPAVRVGGRGPWIPWDLKVLDPVVDRMVADNANTGG